MQAISRQSRPAANSKLDAVKDTRNAAITAPISEPTCLVLLAMGGTSVLAARRRRLEKAVPPVPENP